MPLAEQIATKILLMGEGQVVWTGTPSQLLGLTQAALAISVGIVAGRSQPAILLVSAAAYLISVFLYGNRWERAAA